MARTPSGRTKTKHSEQLNCVQFNKSIEAWRTTPTVGAAEGCDLLIFSDLKKNKIKRSQPSAAPT
jgi:hypothetical protein